MSTFISLLILLFIIGPITPISYCLFPGVKYFYLFGSIAAAIFIHIIRKFDYSKAFFLLGTTCISIPLMCFQGVLREDIRYLIIPFYYLPSFYMASSINKEILKKITDFLTILSFVLSIGAIISFLIVLIFHANPIYSFIMDDGRVSSLFYFTFTNAYFPGLNIIRPSGIFNEPGTLSLFLCFVAVLREIQNRSKTATIFILALGMCTLSLAHSTFFLVFLFHQKRWPALIIILVFLISFTSYISFNSHLNGIESVFFNRIFDENAVDNDARSQMFNNAKNVLSLPVILFGTKIDGTFNRSYADNAYGRMGENPLSPLVYHGLIGSWVFYLTLLMLLAFSIRYPKNGLVYLGYFLLLLQRPHSLYLGYSLMAAVVLYVSFINNKNSNKICF